MRWKVKIASVKALRYQIGDVTLAEKEKHTTPKFLMKLLLYLIN
jgi:hypothetical protein